VSGSGGAYFGHAGMEIQLTPGGTCRYLSSNFPVPGTPTTWQLVWDYDITLSQLAAGSVSIYQKIADAQVFSPVFKATYFNFRVSDCWFSPTDPLEIWNCYIHP